MAELTHAPDAPSIGVSVAIPCCNEAENISMLDVLLRPVIAHLAPYGEAEVLIVDDGSTDDTWQRLQALAARVPEVRLLRHPTNLGLGAALRTAFAHARGAVVVTTDADGTYPLAEIPSLLERLTPGTDIVTASPYHPDGGVDGVPAWRLLFSRGASWCYRAALGRQGRAIHTYTSLFRAYRREILPVIAPEREGFLAVAEVLVRGVLAGCRVAEYPTTLGVRRYGQSKGRVLRMTRAHLGLLADLLGGRVASKALPQLAPCVGTSQAREAVHG